MSPCSPLPDSWDHPSPTPPDKTTPHISLSCRGALLEPRTGVYELSQPDDDQYCLRICRVSRRDLGPLTCSARNRHGTKACSVTLELAGK